MFLCQLIEDMEEYRQDFFDNYNPDPEDAVI